MDLAALGFSLDTRPLEKGKKHLEELAEAAGKAEGAAEDLGKSNRKAGEDAKKYGQDTKSAAEETERLAREQQEASNQTRGLIKLLGGLGASFGGLMIARDAVNAIADFSKEVATLKATIGGTAEQMSALREQAKLVGSSTSFSLAEVAKAQRVLAQAGLEAQDILRATPDVLKFAQAGDFKQLEDAAELLVDVSSQTGKTAKDFKQLSDVMVATADTSTTSAQQLAFGYKYSATLAKEMGTEFKETSAALALLTNNGIKGESAGTALRGMMMSLLNPTNEAEKLFKKLGFSLEELNPAANGLIPALSKLQEKAISMPDLAALFGTEGATAASILTKQYDKLGGMIDKIGDSAGITDRKSKVMSDNLKVAIASIGSAAEAAAVEISDRIGFEDLAKNASQNISGVIGELSGLNDKAREAGTLAEDQAQKYADMGNALKAAGVVAGGFVALQLPAMFAATATAITSAAAATKGFTLALASNPFGLAAVAITSMAAAAIYYQDEIVTTAGVTATVGDSIAAIWDETGALALDAIADFGIGAINWMDDIFSSSDDAADQTTVTWVDATNAVINAFKDLVNYAINAFPAIVISARATANAVVNAFQKMKNFDFSGAFDAFVDTNQQGHMAAMNRLQQDNFDLLNKRVAANIKARQEAKKVQAERDKEIAYYTEIKDQELARLKAQKQAIDLYEGKIPYPKPDPKDRTDLGGDKKGKKAADEAKKLAAEQEKLNNLLQKGSGFSASYAESLALLAKHQDKIPVEEYRAAVERLILSETDAGKAAKKHAEELAKLQEQFANDDAKRAQDLQWQSEELALQASLIGKTSTEQAYLVAAFEAEKEIRSQIIDLTQEQAKYEREGNKWAVDAIDERIAKLQDEAQARKDAAGTLAAQKAVLSGWQSVSSDIERALTDSLMRGFENGENFVDSLKNYIENAFKSFAVTLLLQPVMAPINAIGGPIYSQMMGGQPQQGQGGSFDLGKMFSDSKSSYDSFIDTGLKSSVGQSLGFSTPLTYTDAWAAGQNVSGATVSAGAELTSLGEAASTAGQALGYLPAVMHAAEGRYISAVGSAVGQTFGGPIGSMAGSAIGGLLDDAFGFGEKKPDERKAKFGYGASDALLAEGKQTGWTGSSVFGEFRTYADKWFSDSEMRPAMSAFIDSLESLDNAVADSLKLTADQTTNAIDALKAIDKEYSFGLQWGDFTQNSKAREQIAIDRYSTILDSVESGWGDFVRGFTGSFEQFPAYLQSIVQAMQQFRDAGGDMTSVFGQQVNSIKEFERFAKSGETSAAAFQRLYGVFQITNRVLESLGKSTKGANLATADLRESFVRLAGGMEQLQGYLTEYYDGFYTETERAALVMADLQKEFDKYGATVPKTREEWRKLMESLDLSTESGQQAAAKLYQLQGAFLSVTPAIENATEAIKEQADEQKRLRDELEKSLSEMYVDTDYTGLTEEGASAARAIDELISKLDQLANVGGDVKIGIDAMSRYIEREIPKLYESILAPFKDLLGGKKFTSLGQDIFDLFKQITNAVKAVSEVSQKESAAITKAATYTYRSEERFAGILDGKAISEHGTTLAAIGGGDTEKNTVLAGEMATKYSASFGDIRKWFDEFAIFTDATTGTFSKIEQPLVDGLVDVFDVAKEVTSGQLSTIYETATGKDASTVSDTIDKFAQEVNLSQKSLTEAAKDAVISLDLLAQSDPANAVAKAALGRDATAEERKAIEDAYNWGIANGKALGDIVGDIVNHAVNLDESIKHLGTGTLEAAKDVADFDSAVKNTANANGKNTNYSVYDEAGALQTLKDAEQITYVNTKKAAELQAQAAVKQAAAMADLLRAFVIGVTNSVGGAFDEVIKEAEKIGKTDAELAMADAQASFDDVMRSTVEAVSVTIDGLAALGVTSASKAAEGLIKEFADGSIETAEEMALAVESVFAAVGNVDGVGAIKDKLTQAVKAAQRTMSSRMFEIAKQSLIEITADIDKIRGFGRGIDDAIFNLRLGMSGADVVGLYRQRERDIRSQLETAMQGENLDEQIGLANELRDIIGQRYASEIENSRKLLDFSRGIGDYLRNLRVSDKSTGSIFDRLTEAQKQFQEDVMLSRGTGEQAELARGRVTRASDTLLDLARQYYASGSGYQDIYSQVVSGLEGLQIDTRSEAEKALSAAQEGNAIAEKQIAELQALKGTFDQRMSGLLSKQSEQVSVMQGLAGQLGLSQSAILQALKDLPSGISGAIASTMPMPAVGSAGGAKAPTTSVSGSTQSAFDKAVQSYRETGGIAGGTETLQAAAAATGRGLTETLRAIKEAAKIDGSHKDGLSHVPFDGYVAELHKGERVLTAAENRDYSADVSRIMGGGYGGQSVAPLLNEIKALRQEVATLRNQMATAHQQNLQQREAIAEQSAQISGNMTRTIQRTVTLNI